MNQELSDFAARLCEAISPGGHCFVNAPIRQGSAEALPSMRDDAMFNGLALELFALQFNYNAAYRKLCESRGCTPETVTHWTQIPAVPTSAFKELELSCIPSEERTAVFHSSGTTEQIPSRHFHCIESLAVYEASLLAWFVPNVLGDLRFANDDLRIENRAATGRLQSAIFLAPPPEQAPHSSLVHMFGTIRKRLHQGFGVSPSGGRVNAELQTDCVRDSAAFLGTLAADGSWTLDFDAVRTALIGNPKLILGTAFSFVHLLDFLGEHNLRLQLPAGSRVMETGGYKNRSRSMPKDELHSLITDRFGVTRENIVCEYGMSELSSQAYSPGAPTSGRRVPASETREIAGWEPALLNRFYFPSWARVRIVSPETGREVADGETGLIRVFDLANVFSVMAIQTEDLGIRRGDGFELIGRAQMAEPRGCSLMMEGSASPLP